MNNCCFIPRGRAMILEGLGDIEHALSQLRKGRSELGGDRVCDGSRDIRRAVREAQKGTVEILRGLCDERCLMSREDILDIRSDVRRIRKGCLEACKGLCLARNGYSESGLEDIDKGICDIEEGMDDIILLIE